MKQKNSAHYRRALPEDGVGMLELIESHSSGGALDTVYTRRADAYRSYLADCKDAEITLCVDEEGRIKAQMACLPRRLYMGGEARTAGYLTGLCKRGDGFVNLPRLFHAALDDSKIDLFFCSILDGNDGVFKMLDKKRAYMPELRVISEYTTHLFSPKAIKRTTGHGFAFRRATENDSEALLLHYREYGKHHDFFPEISAFSEFPGLDIECFYLLLHRSGDIVAAGALWDQRDFKQHIVKKYGGAYKTAAKFNFLLRLLRYPPLPKANAVADFAYVGFFAVERDEPALIRAFLGEMAAIARSRCDTLCVGATADSETGRVLQGIKSVHFGSKLCLFDFKKDGARPAPRKRPAYFECGLL
ncbi:MAG: GNAT family N-acetyltransferase [Clostridiales Family XIII bacterium]|jgi:hypothetical protein|nr:GNAT family N-acetyltransferase [Clostridiales Family XIII bacterium]